jgi:hypothetical protein
LSSSLELEEEFEEELDDEFDEELEEELLFDCCCCSLELLFEFELLLLFELEFELLFEFELLLDRGRSSRSSLLRTVERNSTRGALCEKACAPNSWSIQSGTLRLSSAEAPVAAKPVESAVTAASVILRSGFFMGLSSFQLWGCGVKGPAVAAIRLRPMCLIRRPRRLTQGLAGWA